MLLVANKVDLVHLRKITEEQGRDLAHKLGIPYIETSAKDPPLNIDATFHEVSEKLIWINENSRGRFTFLTGAGFLTNKQFIFQRSLL